MPAAHFILRTELMSTGLNIRQDGALDFLSLGALVHRLDPAIIPSARRPSARSRERR